VGRCFARAHRAPSPDLCKRTSLRGTRLQDSFVLLQPDEELLYPRCAPLSSPSLRTNRLLTHQGETSHVRLESVASLRSSWAWTYALSATGGRRSPLRSRPPRGVATPPRQRMNVLVNRVDTMGLEPTTPSSQKRPIWTTANGDERLGLIS
jgi:hypothetical protein